jgi:hypothetical protein
MQVLWNLQPLLNNILIEAFVNLLPLFDSITIDKLEELNVLLLGPMLPLLRVVTKISFLHSLNELLLHDLD